ncbi:hypothetical protein [uncultured Sphingomonas sp.]|uniref:hypothetical protein n=1 Tax=uncultured Sphingomonas sp. TaxID=158754 RepID=UPI0035CA098A
MKETSVDREAEFDSDLFSPEELAMMDKADGIVDGFAVEHDPTEIQAQYIALAKMVAEGGERERQLRALVADLTMLAESNMQVRSHHEQTQNLAKIVLASAERELHLQQCLEAFRSVTLTRARDVI